MCSKYSKPFSYNCSSKRKCHALNSIFVSPPPIFILQLYNLVYTFQVLILTVLWSPISSNMVQKNVMVFSSILSSKKGVLCHVTEGWLHMVVIYLTSRQCHVTTADQKPRAAHRGNASLSHPHYHRQAKRPLMRHPRMLLASFRIRIALGAMLRCEMDFTLLRFMLAVFWVIDVF